MVILNFFYLATLKYKQPKINDTFLTLNGF